MNEELIIKIIAALSVLLTGLAALYRATKPRMSKIEKLKIATETLKMIDELKEREEVKDQIQAQIETELQNNSTSQPVSTFKIIAGIIGSAIMWFLAYKLIMKESYVWAFFLAFYGMGPIMLGFDPMKTFKKENNKA